MSSLLGLPALSPGSWAPCLPCLPAPWFPLHCPWYLLLLPRSSKTPLSSVSPNSILVSLFVYLCPYLLSTLHSRTILFSYLLPLLSASLPTPSLPRSHFSSSSSLPPPFVPPDPFVSPSPPHSSADPSYSSSICSLGPVPFHTSSRPPPCSGDQPAGLLASVSFLTPSSVGSASSRANVRREGKGGGGARGSPLGRSGLGPQPCDARGEASARPLGHKRRLERPRGASGERRSRGAAERRASFRSGASLGPFVGGLVWSLDLLQYLLVPHPFCPSPASLHPRWGAKNPER